MRLTLALLLPGIQFLTIGRPFSALACLLLQASLLGWIPAAIWSVRGLREWRIEQQAWAAMRRP